MKKAKPNKRRCETCPAFNRRVALVYYFGREVLMCELCAKVASRISEEADKQAQQQKNILSKLSSAKFPLRQVTTA